MEYLMKTKTLYIAMLLCALFSVACYPKDISNEKSELSLSNHSWLVGEWRSSNGVWITIEDNGKLIVRDNKESILYEGIFELLFYRQNESGLIDIFVVEIDSDRNSKSKEVPGHSVIPSAFFSGEGDTKMIKLFLLDNDFGRKLTKHFDVEHSDALVLYSRNVDGNWPDFLIKYK